MLKKYKDFAPAFIRYGLAFVFFSFGISQFLHPENWVQLLPDFLINILPGTTIMTIVGTYNMIVSLMLVLGLYVEIAAILGIMHLVLVLTRIGFGFPGIRDVGLLFGLISVLLNGSDKLCLRR